MTAVLGPATVDPNPEVRVDLRPSRTVPDRLFRSLAFAAASVALVTIGAIALYLVNKSFPALRVSKLSFLTSDHWAPTGAPPHYGILGDLVGSLLIAVIALTLALPVSIATALMINEYAPRAVRTVLVGLVDLLAALPSLIYGLWGLRVLSPHMHGLGVWLSTKASFVPLFRTPQQTYGQSIFVAGIVVSVIILPILTSITREVMSQAPREVCEAALALGGTRWGMITDVILPFARNGIIGGALLGLGRAAGETIAVVLILAPTDTLSSRILEPTGGSIAALIAADFTQAAGPEQSALVLAGLTLFATTLAFSIAARVVVARSARA